MPQPTEPPEPSGSPEAEAAEVVEPTVQVAGSAPEHLPNTASAATAMPEIVSDTHLPDEQPTAGATAGAADEASAADPTRNETAETTPDAAEATEGPGTEQTDSGSTQPTQSSVGEYTFESCTIEIRLQLMPARTLADREGEDRRVWIGVRENDGSNPGDPLVREVRLLELGGWPVPLEELLTQLRAEMPARSRAAKARQPSSANATRTGNRGSAAIAGERVRPTTQQLSGEAPASSGASVADPSARRPQFGAPMPRRASAASSPPSRQAGASGTRADPEPDGTPVVQQELF